LEFSLNILSSGSCDLLLLLLLLLLADENDAGGLGLGALMGFKFPNPPNPPLPPFALPFVLGAPPAAAPNEVVEGVGSLVWWAVAGARLRANTVGGVWCLAFGMAWLGSFAGGRTLGLCPRPCSQRTWLERQTIARRRRHRHRQ